MNSAPHSHRPILFGYVGVDTKQQAGVIFKRAVTWAPSVLICVGAALLSISCQRNRRTNTRQEMKSSLLAYFDDVVCVCVSTFALNKGDAEMINFLNSRSSSLILQRPMQIRRRRSRIFRSTSLRRRRE